MRFPRLPRFQSGTTQCQEQSREEKKNDAKKPKKEFILGASLPFQKLSRIWKGFLGIWDLYEIPENAKFLEGVRDLTTTRQAGFPKMFARDVVLEKKMVFGMIKMTEVPVAGLS